MTCPLCQSPVPPGRRWCPHCGERLVKKRRRSFMPALAALAAVAAILAVILPRTPAASTPRERFAQANRALAAPVLELLNGAGCAARLTVTADIPGDPLSAILHLSALTADCALSEDGLTADLTLRILGSAALTGSATYSQGLVGIYIPELDDTYYRFDLANLTDLPSAGQIADYVDLALSMVADGDLELTVQDGVETFVCRPGIYEGLTWTVTELDGQVLSLNVALPGYELSADLGERDEKITLALSAPKFTVNVQIDTKNRPETPKPPDKSPVYVPKSELPALADKLLGGISDVL